MRRFCGDSTQSIKYAFRDAFERKDRETHIDINARVATAVGRYPNSG